jgi:hypothetical protein
LKVLSLVLSKFNNLITNLGGTENYNFEILSLNFNFFEISQFSALLTFINFTFFNKKIIRSTRNGQRTVLVEGIVTIFTKDFHRDANF